ncbi:MAG: biotin--[acetyl-CoA-carboxylase] ligase, partial [Bowdeniella nasicola]|nr:biotin--[acetyl-CoA-carboxylase] ligase [Bowdeniella nasicola]
STNSYALAQLDEASDPRALDTKAYGTDQQTAGRGRANNTWQTPPRQALALSVIIDTTEIAPEWRTSIVHMAGWAVHTHLSGLITSRPIALGWPNDILLGGFPERAGWGSWRKVAGILCQLHPSNMMVVGVGINCLQRADQLPVAHATSLHHAVGSEITPEMLAAPLTRMICRRAHAWRDAGGDLSSFLPALNARAAWRGETVVAMSGTTRLGGHYLGIDKHGYALIETTEGTQRWHAGEVRHVRRGTPTPK